MPLRRVMSTSWPPIFITVVFTAAILLHYGVGLLDIVTYAVYLVLGITLPGVLAWRMLLAHLHTTDDPPGPTWFEDLSLGTIFGFGIQLPVYLLGVWIGVPLLIVALPVAALVVSFTTYGRTIWTLPTGRLDVRASWALAASTAYGLTWLGRKAFAIRPLDLPSNRPPSIDETFHQALVSETAHRFPPQIPFLLDTRLDYHWFVHAQIAASDHATALDPITMLREVMPAVSLALGLLGLGAVALRLTRSPLAAAVAPAILVAGAYQLIGPHFDTFQYYEAYLSRRFVTSPSQSYGVVMSMPALMLILEVLRPGRRPRPSTWAALTLALLALSGAKATFLPIFLCGALALWGLTLVFMRRLDRTLSTLCVLLVAVTAWAQYVLFGGQSGGLAFDPFATARTALAGAGIDRTPLSTLVMILTMLTGWLLYGVGVIGLARARGWRDPRAQWLALSVPVGIGVAFLLFRSGLSQLWFQRTVAELVVLLSAWGLCLLIPSVTRRQAWTYAGVAAGSGLVAFLLATLAEHRRGGSSSYGLGSLVATVLFPVAVVVVFAAADKLLARRTAGRTVIANGWSTAAVCVVAVLGLGSMNVFSLSYDVVSGRSHGDLFYPPLWAAGGTEAATYIAENSDVDDVVATNIHCLRPHVPVCDNRNFWVAAWSERRIVIEGWGYTAETNKNYVRGEANSTIPPPDPKRLRINDAAFKRPSEQTIDALVDAYDPHWLFVSKRYAADLAGLETLDGGPLTKRFENSDYVVYEINANAD